MNHISASSNENGLEIADNVNVNFNMLSQNLESKEIPFTSMNISLGDKRFIFDEKTGQTWIPEQPYKTGSWGYIGGELYTIKGSTRTGYGTTKDIIGTELEPIYQTQRIGIQQFRFDVSDGEYELAIHFAELLSPAKSNELVYNLGGGTVTEEFKERSFSILLNGQEIITNLSNTEYLEPLHAVAIKHKVIVNNNSGITLNFVPIKGEAILNAIQLKKIY